MTRDFVMDELEAVREKEAALVFAHFNSGDAWKIGNLLVERASAAKKAVAIRVSVNRRELFYFAFDGTSPDNGNWVRRKENVVYYTGKSSYQIKLYLDMKKDTIAGKYGLNPADYAASGGSVPIVLKDTGAVGAITVSGMSQAEDHAFVVSAMEDYLTEQGGSRA